MDTPAFPCTNHHGHKLTGMTLRDYFAASALQGFIQNNIYLPWNSPSELAVKSYEMADAMLAEREREQ